MSFDSVMKDLESVGALDEPAAAPPESSRQPVHAPETPAPKSLGRVHEAFQELQEAFQAVSTKLEAFQELLSEELAQEEVVPVSPTNREDPLAPKSAAPPKEEYPVEDAPQSDAGNEGGSSGVFVDIPPAVPVPR